LGRLLRGGLGPGGPQRRREAEFFVHHDSYFTDMANGPAAHKWATRKTFKSR
jgi:hypothetical protein